MTGGWITHVMFLVNIIQFSRGEPRPLRGGIAFTVCSATEAFFLMALCLRYATPRTPVFDSLSADAYGIDVVKYVFVLWLQNWLLGVSLPAAAKCAIALVGALFLSWGTVTVPRRIPAVAKVL